MINSHIKIFLTLDFETKVEFISSPDRLKELNKNEKTTQIICLVDFRHKTLTYDFIGLYKSFSIRSQHKYGDNYNFLIIDMGDRSMFEYIANTYLIGNHDTPGIMAT